MISRSVRPRKKAIGFIMAGVGFLFILANAVDYVFDRGLQPVTRLIIGLVLVVTGMNLAGTRE